jgi:60 kDa SS-A/Ro ribonucleoprotein
MTNYAKLFNPAVTPQSEPIPGRSQVENSAGGYVFQLDIWGRLRRFLILGSDSPTFYVNAKDLTRANAECVIECWKTDPAKTFQIITDVSHWGRARSNDPAIFAIALGSVLEEPYSRARQYAFDAVADVCRTGTHLFTWMDYRKQLGGGDGRGFKRAVARWYADKAKRGALALQMVKYRNRAGWTHADAIKVAHKGAGHDEGNRALYQWIKGKEPSGPLPALVLAHEEAMALKGEGASATENAYLVKLIEDYRLPREAIPTWALSKPEVWEALTPHMGLTALIRNLGVMTACGAISMQRSGHVTDKLASAEDLRASRVHPFAILQALAVYKGGFGIKGGKRWQPVPRIIDALDAAFYNAFENVETTGKRIMLALDVSGSMGAPMMGSPLSCREAAAAMAMVTLAREPNAIVYGFTRGTSPTMHRGYPAGLTPLLISARQRLDDVVRYLSHLDFGGTDCALPFVVAQQQGLQLDAFAVYTDGETWAGNIHPVQALKQYRQATGINSRSIVIGMTASPFSIADPQDGGMLDLVGFDASAPAIMADFIGGAA